VTVVVPTIGRGTLSLTLDALKSQTRPPDAVEVVEDAERRGHSWAVNEGIRRASGDLVAFVDDDCVPPADWLERLIAAVDRYGAEGAGGNFAETDPLLADRQRRRTFPKAEGVDESGKVGNSGNLLLRLACLRACEARDGYVFDERWRFDSGDLELALRLRRAGARLVFVPNPVRHLKRMDAGAYLRHQFRRGRGIAMLAAAHRAGRGGPGAGESLAWGDPGKGGGAWRRRVAAFWKKGVGPFDAGSFHSLRAFAIFWLGEKFEAAGYIRQLLADRGTR
jgi:GT2 family glycosyltransferase